MDKMLEALQAKFTLNELDVGEFTKIKVKGMNFTIKRYHAKGIGNVSVMKAAGFFGLMKMDTLIINPTERDMPLFSYDRVLAMGNDTLILELYDTLLGETDLRQIKAVNKAYASLSNHDLGQHWYDNIKLSESASKKGKKKDTASFDEMARDYFKAYVELAGKAEECDSDAKKEKASVYVEGLLKNGGPSTDIFKQYYGEEKTAYLFRKILFGTT